MCIYHIVAVVYDDEGSIPSLSTKFNEDKRRKVMNVSDLPQELLSRIREQFYATPKIRQMEVTRQMYLRNGNFKSALALAQDMEALYNKCVYEYMKENGEQVEKIDIATMEMPKEDKEDIMRHFLACFMCADIIKSSIQDMDTLLHKYDKDLRMELFNDIRQVMEMCEQKLSYLQQNSDYLKDLVWGEKCDDMYEMILSKAGAIMRKRKKGDDWGKNTEKFYK